MARSGIQEKIISSDGYNKVRFSWMVAEQNAAEKYSVISWSLRLVSGAFGELISDVPKRYYINIDGDIYAGENDINIANNSLKDLASGTTKIYHSSDGTKSFSVWWEQDFDVFNYGGTLIPYSSDNGVFTIDKIDVLSTITASNGTLGTQQTISITPYDSMFVHKLKYTCGSVSGYLGGSDTSYMGDISVKWTPPISLARQSTSSTKVSIKLTLYTYSGDGVLIGQTTKTISCAIPSSVKPSCELSVSDPNGYATKYGFYVKSQSQLKIDVTPTIAYGSAIASYEIVADGMTYTESSVETDVLKSVGTLTITAKVKDKRGRIGTASANITVYDYTAPTVTQLKVNRCNSDGSENDKGEYIKVTFGGEVTALDGKNTAYYQLDYKPTYEANYTNSVALDTYKNVYSVESAEYIFKADTGSSFTVAISITDDFQTSARTTGASTALTIMHFGADGKSMGIGKIAEVENGLDIGFKMRFYGGVLHRVLDPGTYLNDLTVANTYVGENVSYSNYGNLPDDFDADEFLLEVKGNDTLIQILTELKENGREFTRCYVAGAWSAWGTFVGGGEGTPGAPGKDGEDGKTPYISNGYWYIDGVNTNVKAEGVDGKDGKTPYVSMGYWYIDGVSTGVKAEGVDGKDGTNGKDGVDGKTPYVSMGYWYIDGVSTGVKAEGVDGSDASVTAANIKSALGYTPANTEHNHGYIQNGTVGIKVSDSNEVSFASNANYIYFGYENRMGSSGVVTNYKFGTHSGATGAAKGTIECGKLVEDGTALSNKYAPKEHTHDYVPLNDGCISLKPSSGEGGQIMLEAASNDSVNNGICLDTANGDFRLFGLQSADGTSKAGFGTILIIDPYDKTISGGYTFDGTSAKAVADANGNNIATTYLATRGSATRPKYNNNDLALLSDVPSTTETWTFTLEDGSTVTKAVNVG